MFHGTHNPLYVALIDGTQERGSLFYSSKVGKKEEFLVVAKSYVN